MKRVPSGAHMSFRILVWMVFLLWISPRYASASETQTPMNVILISLDTVRPDHLSCYGYFRKTSPHIDRIAKEGVMFTHAFSQAPWTVTSHLAMFYSRYPRRQWLDKESNGPKRRRDNLTSILLAHDYHTMSSVGLEFPDPDYPMGNMLLMTDAFQSFEHRLYGSNLSSLPAGVFDWIRNHRDNPFFIFLHGMDAHGPHVLPDTYDPYVFNPKRLGDLPTTMSDLNQIIRDLMPTADDIWSVVRSGWLDARMGPRENREQIVAQYDAQIYYADQGLGQLFTVLENLHLMERTILVIVSDHGQAFGEHGKFSVHADQLYDEVIHMVLIVRDPRHQPHQNKVESIVQGIDVMPTILGLLNIPVPEKAEGRSLVPLIQTGRDSGRDEFAMSLSGSSMWSFRTREWTLIQNGDGEQELYHISQDPREQHNVAGTYPSVVSRLREKLKEIYASEEEEVSGIDPETWIQEHGYW